MILLTIFLIFVFVALGTGVLASISDFRGLVIPNLYSLIVLGSFAACYLLLWLGGRDDDVFGSFVSHIISAAIVFVVTLVMFMLKGLGAADSKLGTAYALWVGLPGLMPFLFYMALAGGLLGLAALALRKWKPVRNPVEGSWVARVQAGESKVPYGAAIAVGALVSFIDLGYFSSEVLSSFLMTP
jgi:prepilin peptidase CpaA